MLILEVMHIHRVVKVSLESGEGSAELRKLYWGLVNLSRGCECPAGVRRSFHGVVKVSLESGEGFTEW
jgi:hypothetical protein